jgi:hypothetical protein
MSLRRGLLLLAALALLVGLAGFRLYRRLSSPSSEPPSPESAEATDPRLRYEGPFRNIHPDVRYVGDASCVGCHDAIAKSYAHHPMGRSLVSARALLDRQVYTAGANNPFTVLGRSFEVTRRGKHLWHRQLRLEELGKPVVELAQEVHWVLGSGSKGYSYLTERDGYLFQTAISWFTQKKRWDLSPGFGPAVLSGRLVPASCLFCHANGVQEHPSQPDRFEPPVFVGQAIGCERCHGPGEHHVRTSDRWDIVNPARLSPELRDAVCEQCHLEGEARALRAGRKLFDYRPGLPLHDFWAVLVREGASGEDARAVSHVEQMYQSRCFQKPVDGVKLGCMTCHDPHVHVGPARRQTHYRAACLKCHDPAKGQHPCSEPLARRSQVSPQDSCIDCHMPRQGTWDIAHTAATDHRILRRPPMTAPVHAGSLDPAAVVDFYHDRFPGGDPQRQRSLGLGLLKMMATGRLPPQHADQVLRLLELALVNDPGDFSVRQGKVEVYQLLRRPGEALAEAELLLPEHPGSWPLLAQAASAAELDGQPERARDYWRQVVDINPFMPEYLLRLVQLQIRAGQLDEAQRYCEHLLQLDPFNVPARQAWVGFLLQQGRRAKAERAFDIIRKLEPPDLAQREKWLRQQIQPSR